VKFNKNEKGFISIELILILVVIVLLGAVGYFVYNHHHKTVQNTVTVLNGSEENITGNDNNNRSTDAEAINVEIGNYIDNNSVKPTTIEAGSTPSTLIICSTPCSKNSSVSVKLTYFKPQNISFHQYEPNLTVPNVSTMYIIDNATCKSNTAIGTQQTGAFSVDELFAIQNGSKIVQQCIT